MALVLNTTPGTFYSAHDPLLFVVNEPVKSIDPVTYPNYKYVCDIFLNGTIQARQKAFPAPDNKRGVFDIGPIVRAELAAKFNPAANVLRAQELGAGEFFIDVVCKFGEEVAFTLYPNLLTDSTRTYFTHYNGRLNGVAGTALSGVANEILSNRPLVSNVYRNNLNTFIPFISTTTDNISVEVKAYDSNGLASTHAATVTPTAANNLQILNISPAVINTLYPGTITDGSLHYTISFNSQLYRFNLVCEPKYQPYTLHFLNQFGGFDSFDFTKVSRKSEEIERKSFSKLPYTVDSVGVASLYNANKVYNEVNTTYAVEFKEKMVLNSDLLNDDTFEWLSEMFRSNMVYLQEGQYLTPVSITGTSFEHKKRINDKLTNLKIELDFGVSSNTQFR